MKLGGLYNAWKDSIFPAELFQIIENPTRIDNPKTILNYYFEDSFREKFHKLQVDDELTVSLLSGLLEMSGKEGEYFSKERKNSRIIQATLFYTYETCYEDFNPFDQESPLRLELFQAGSGSGITHFVKGIQYGKSVFISFDYEENDIEGIEGIKEKLESCLEKLMTWKGMGGVDFSPEEKETLKKFNISVHGESKDVSISNDPAEIIEFMKEIPHQVLNEGKGVPIRYSLLSLTLLQNPGKVKFDSLMGKINQDTLVKIQDILMKLKSIKEEALSLHIMAQECSEFVTLETLEEIEILSTNSIKAESSFLKEIQAGILLWRSQNQSQQLLEALNKFDNDDFIKDIDKKVHDFRSHNENNFYTLKTMKTSLGITLLPKHQKVEDFTLIHQMDDKLIYVFYCNTTNRINDENLRFCLEYKKKIEDLNSTFLLIDVGTNQNYCNTEEVNGVQKWVNNQLIGYYKKITLGNGDIYEGDFQDGKRTGKGKYTWKDGDIYEGDFQDGKSTGKGKYIWRNGDFYEGDFQDNKSTGKGKYTWKNGNVYEGDFQDDKRTGKGKFTWKDGDVYEGDFQEDQRTGKGKFTWKNGNFYEGDFQEGRSIGNGKFTCEDGDIYEGDF